LILILGPDDEDSVHISKLDWKPKLTTLEKLLDRNPGVGGGVDDVKYGLTSSQVSRLVNAIVDDADTTFRFEGVIFASKFLNFPRPALLAFVRYTGLVFF